MSKDWVEDYYLLVLVLSITAVDCAGSLGGVHKLCCQDEVGR